MILAITGTPGTGKTSVAKSVANITGWNIIGLNELAEEKGLYSGYDEKRFCRIVNMDAIKKEIKEIWLSGKNLIIESHYAHDMDADLVVVLRTKPDEIRKRAAEKGWKRAKTEENVVAEIMEECKIESLEQGKMAIEVDTTGKSPRKAANEIADILHKDGLFLKRSVKIPEKLKDELREPYGVLFPDMEKAVAYMKGSEIIAVGDLASHSLYSLGVKPRIFVVDGKVRRKRFKKKIPLDYETIKAKNRVGYLSKELWMAAQDALKADEPIKIKVAGEEDMAVLPFLLLSEEGRSVIYGLLDRGVCVVKTSMENKTVARNLLRKITRH